MVQLGRCFTCIKRMNRSIVSNFFDVEMSKLVPLTCRLNGNNCRHDAAVHTPATCTVLKVTSRYITPQMCMQLVMEASKILWIVVSQVRETEYGINPGLWGQRRPPGDADVGPGQPLNPRERSRPRYFWHVSVPNGLLHVSGSTTLALVID
jgi:hypothetical protein